MPDIYRPNSLQRVHMPDIYRPIAARLSRRGVLSLGSAALAGLVIDPRSAAAVTVDINQANVQPMPIAIADFLGGVDGR